MFDPHAPMGVHEGIDHETYSQVPGARRSELKQLWEGKPLDVLHYRQRDWTGTTAMSIGTAVDLAILTPELYPHEVANSDLASRRGNAWKEFAEANYGKICLTQPEVEQVDALVGAVLRCKIARKLLEGTQRQLSAWWTHHSLSGRDLLCKTRPDAVIEEHGRTIDLKTCASFSDHDFSSACWKYHYDVQAYMNAEGFKESGFEWKEHVLICVRKTEPIDVRCFVWTLESPWMQLGEARFQSMADQYIDMIEKDETHGWGKDISFLPMPKWIEFNRTEIIEANNKTTAKSNA